MATVLHTSEDILTPDEAARYLKISEQTLRKLRQRKAIRAKQVGRQWRYLKEDLDRFLRTDDELHH